MTPTLTLADFIEARIAEDERGAEAARAGLDRPWVDWCDLVWRKWAEVDDGLADHLERLDPARVLAQCAAYRSIVAAHQRHTLAQGGAYCDCQAIELEGPWGGRDDIYPCETLEALASIWADHEDYDEAWA